MIIEITIVLSMLTPVQEETYMSYTPGKGQMDETNER
jgi:hypothetical protein